MGERKPLPCIVCGFQPEPAFPEDGVRRLYPLLGEAMDALAERVKEAGYA